MFAMLLALAAAAGFGGSDFAAGLAARGTSVVRVTIVAEVAGAVLGLLIVPWISVRAPSAADAGWGAAAGVSGVIGAMALYLGFRHAAFSVASTLSAVGSAALSVLAGLLFGERPGGLSLAGIALALPAIAAVSASPGRRRARPQPSTQPGLPLPPAPESWPDQEPEQEPGQGQGPRTRPAHTGRHLAGVGYGLVAGAGFALYFIGLSRAGPGAGLWPVLVAQLTALVVAAGAGVVTGQLRLPPAGTLPLAALTGVAGVAGTACFFLATHAGLLAVTAVITSLYPAGTIMLARVLLGERLTLVRLAGLLLAAGSVVLIAVGGTG
jgi:drug/metabolite transporter (DMT)-like permease